MHHAALLNFSGENPAIAICCNIIWRHISVKITPVGLVHYEVGLVYYEVGPVYYEVGQVYYEVGPVYYERSVRGAQSMSQMQTDLYSTT